MVTHPRTNRAQRRHRAHKKQKYCRNIYICVLFALDLYLPSLSSPFPEWIPMEAEYSCSLSATAELLVGLCTDMAVSVSTSLSEQQSSKDVAGMMSLHTQLQQEADRIRKWKIQTEIEMNQKVYLKFCT